jgi:predicted adenine nucleotide alpha hydrolase (AANH) superfamily ATPase
MASLLLHTCCAPCATYCVQHWRQKGLAVTILWYNPNIHPFTEHLQRLQALQSLAQKEDIPLIVAEGYDVIAYFRAVVGHEKDRCSYCFRLRLSMAALIARLRGFDAFSTTLLISPYQDQQLLKEVGEELAAKQGVSFLYEDLRPGFEESHKISRELGLYRQKYCGCLYSEWERFGKVRI